MSLPVLWCCDVPPPIRKWIVYVWSRDTLRCDLEASELGVSDDGLFDRQINDVTTESVDALSSLDGRSLPVRKCELTLLELLDGCVDVSLQPFGDGVRVGKTSARLSQLEVFLGYREPLFRVGAILVKCIDSVLVLDLTLFGSLPFLTRPGRDVVELGAPLRVARGARLPFE